MRSTFKVSFFLKRNAKKTNGKAPIIVRITLDGKIAQFSCKLEISPIIWSVPLGKATGRNAESVSINATLEEIKASIHKHYHHLQVRESIISAEQLKNAFLGHDEDHETLLQLFSRHNEDFQKLVGVCKSNSTYHKYELAQRRIEEFMRLRYNISDIAFHDLSLMFINDYELYLRTHCKLSNNVAAKMIQYLKKIVTTARNSGLIQKDPFASHNIKINRVDRGYLDKQELEKIHKKEISFKRLEQVRDIFIFCCYTGLSYIDVRALTKANIRIAFDENLWIMTKRHKTDNPVHVRLLDIPKMIIEKYVDKMPDDRVLPVMSNQKMNSYLKELADICGIEKNITFHMARHTFATTIGLANGVPIESISKMLGHTNIKTTQIYARITDNKLSSDMEQLAGRLNNQEKIAIL